MIGRKKEKNKICSRYSFCLTRAGGFLKKIQKRHSDYISSKTRLGKAEKEEKKFHFENCFYLTRVKTFPKNFKKK